MEQHKLYNGEVTLYYDDSKHLYFVTDKENNLEMAPIIGVTTVTSVLEKPALINWAVYKMCIPYIRENLKPNKKYDELEIEKILKEAGRQHTIKKEEAGQAGTMVHAWAENYIKGRKPKKPKNPQLLNGVKAFLNWVEAHKVKFIASEKKIYSRLFHYAGTLDAIGTIDGKLALIDFKTGSGLYPEMLLQVAAYLRADREESERKYNSAWIARFDKETAEFETKCIPIEEVNKDFQAFLGALAVRQRLIELKRESKQ